MVIYPVDSLIHLSNNPGQVNSFARSLILTEAKRYFGNGLSRDQIAVETMGKVCNFIKKNTRQGSYVFTNNVFVININFQTM